VAEANAALPQNNFCCVSGFGPVCRVIQVKRVKVNAMQQINRPDATSKGFMTTIMREEATFSVNGNWGSAWTPAVGLDDVDSPLGSQLVETQRLRERPLTAELPEKQKTFRLDEPSRPEDQFEGIIGCSASLRGVFAHLKIVAPTDCTVLILGETGTGKELVARALHNRSSRRDRPFVRVNCAAIPSGLLESELFGHERGAFTGAIARKIGRFELANGGTLFLDEIGDIPLELQPKLLRVLQEQEFERLGSTQTLRVDVRVVAATSRHLPQMVADREFRGDLYYRLNVFPMRLPALRERAEDIPLLVRHFVQVCARRVQRSIDHISMESVNALLRYSWPGNIRELQNFVERAVILSPGKLLRLPLSELNGADSFPVVPGQCADTQAVTLKDAEREHIIQALAETNWIVSGVKGAAARLGLKRTTLISKMQRLGISRAMA